ncbi:hypothetical protein GPECTOR_16g654 [Gonium pectorale]|uniref:Uncharacterized protein n=1 Tax=Gonium pectorale TaxID=33097 RepID=A0A150GKV3_GONPE|nr:hypothetical protein GPECTOR_16g654 [Gonium pectorale]|eukprot:KXZ50479.1 hypothetical protein GPECTOR_16g654 [Gonium pectorale]
MSDEDVIAVRERVDSGTFVRLAIVEGMLRPKARRSRKGANTLVKTWRLDPADPDGRLQLRMLSTLGPVGEKRFLLPHQLQTDPNKLWQTEDVVQIVNTRPGPDAVAGCSFYMDSEDEKEGTMGFGGALHKYCQENECVLDVTGARVAARAARRATHRQQGLSVRKQSKAAKLGALLNPQTARTAAVVRPAAVSQRGRACFAKRMHDV